MSYLHTPWKVEYDTLCEDCGPQVMGILDCRGDWVVRTDAGTYPPSAEQAELIVRAVNADAMRRKKQP